MQDKLNTIPLENPDDSRCRGCTALCCHNLTLPAPPPATPEALQDLLWRLHFDTVRLCIIDGNWFMIVSGRCTFLGDDNMCTIYETRPEQCRKYNPPFCERYMNPYEVVFHSPQELKDYLSAQGALPA
ncbi:MAG: YkgJ family cysteine cluster protein [Acidobacteriota bacterium]|nr:YkgJ family cysteine cluster protein [Acidobacteriota bacterium]